MKKYIGIDLGGTHVRVALVSEDGTIIQEIKRETRIDLGREYVVENIIKMIEELEGYQEALGIGMAVPGPVNQFTRTMTIATNLPGFKGYNFAEIIEQRLNKPVFVDNDANMAGLAEAVLGAGKDYPFVYYITISTGIGGALIINHKVHSGALGYAGEVANIVIDRNRQKYNNLNIGAVENEASGTAIQRKVQEQIAKDIDNRMFLQMVRDYSDETAIKIFNDAMYDVALMMADVAHVVDPHIFVLGGGILNSDDLVIPKLKEYFDTLVHEPMRNTIIVKASLPEPGIVGAAMLARTSINE